MIVCVCNAIREDEVRAGGPRGRGRPRSAPISALGCEPMCGCCLDYAQEVIDESMRPRASVSVNFLAA